MTLFGVLVAMRQDIPDVSEPVLGTQTAVKFGRLRAVFMAYGLYGAGYIVYMTFIVAVLRHHGAAAEVVTWFWTALGSAAVVASFLWGQFLDRASGGRGVAVHMGLVLVGVLVPLWFTTAMGFVVSGILFGSAFLAVVTSVTAIARDSLSVSQWTPALGALTVCLWIGPKCGAIAWGMGFGRRRGDPTRDHFECCAPWDWNCYSALPTRLSRQRS